MDYGIEKAKIVVLWETRGANGDALDDLRAIWVLQLYGMRPEPLGEMVELLEGDKAIGSERLVIGVREMDELDGEGVFK